MQKKSELEKHAQGQKHITSIKSVSKQPTLMSLPAVSNSQQEKLVKEGEIKLVAFIVEHNLPLNVMPHMPHVVSIAPLASLVPGIIGPDKLNEVDREWRLLRTLILILQIMLM